MGEHRANARLSWRQTVRAGALVIAFIVLAGLCGCSKRQRAVSAIERAYARGNYQEAVALCERALRSDIAETDVFFFYGLSLLALDRDGEAFDRLNRAVSMTPARGPEVAERLLGTAREALSRGKTPQAARRARAASECCAEVELGPFEYLVADSYFDEKRWEDAAERYRRALSALPDTSAAEKAYYNLASCYAAASDTTSTIETLERQLSRFPRGALAGQGEWMLVNLMYDRGRSEFQRGNYEQAAAMATGIIGRSENGVVVQRARLLLGESYERMGDYASAYEQYEAIVLDERGASGRFAERARARIKAIREAGLR